MTHRKLSARDVIKLLKNARISEESLKDLVFNIRSKTLPEKHYTSAFDVFHLHLKTPVDQASLDDKRMCRIVVSSLLGLGALKNTYFIGHKEQLRQCWPDVIDWSKAIFRGRKYRDIDGPNLEVAGAFMCGIGQIFDIVAHVDVELVNNDDIFHFALELWKGDEEHIIAPNLYSTCPLLACHSTSVDQVNRFGESSAYDPRLLVDIILVRFSAAVVPSPKGNIEMAADLADLLCRFVRCGTEPVMKTLMNSVDAVTVLIRGLNTVLDDAHQTAEHSYTILCAFEVIYTFFSFGVNVVQDAVHAGFLRVLFSAADTKKYDFGEKPTTLLKHLQHNLVTKRVVTAAMTSMSTLASRRDFDLPRILRASTPIFQEEWKIFESLLLEHAIIFKLFDHGYAEEHGACASCCKKSPRKCLRKCAGCGTILYCSASCERNDWHRHRVACKSAGGQIDKCFDASYSRLSRRLATLQLHRYWPGIASLAKSKNIDDAYLGVRLRHSSSPFKFEVFDCRNMDVKGLRDAFRKTPHLSLLAEESVRARVEHDDKTCAMLVVTTMGFVDVPYLVYLTDDFDADTEVQSGCRSTPCLNGDDSILLPRKHDIVENIMSKLHTPPISNWRTRWIDKPFESLAKQAAPLSSGCP
ncbi:hypothetical protein SCHPADRAFT_899970 [Schizopora paradoxa]|uniref:MYND-type domain-containing protein n=1 Tax=Schizopora paradoxa TaxID=27342 RepID=A0A0H2S2S1_9AGAM|nr:hypothetical protein SCHPADRAFT_899970 [Schizopora paradoxa]